MCINDIAHHYCKFLLKNTFVNNAENYYNDIVIPKWVEEGRTVIMISTYLTALLMFTAVKEIR